MDQDLTEGFAQTQSAGEKEGEEEDDDEGEKEEDNVDEEEEEEEEEENDAEMEGASSSLEDSAEKPTEETPSPKPEELKEKSVPDGEQKDDRGAEVSEQLDTTGEEKTDDSTKPANGMADDSSKNQSGSNKKLSLFRRLSSSRSKQNNDRDQTPTEAAVRRDAAAIQGEPPSPAAAGNSQNAETNRGGAQQRSVPSGARGPRSGACTIL